VVRGLAGFFALLRMTGELFVRSAHAHLSDGEAVAKMGHPDRMTVLGNWFVCSAREESRSFGFAQDDKLFVCALCAIPMSEDPDMGHPLRSKRKGAAFGCALWLFWFGIRRGTDGLR
jgi:hypothetical protein